VLVLAGLGLMVVAFFSPMWWVSLKAPNYPPTTFPQGVRIEMHWTGVENGCKLVQREEVEEDEPLDCVHEMNTINHYIGMEPIERGAQYEFAAAPGIFIVMGSLLVILLFYQGRLAWLLGLPAILAPFIFLADFSYWLRWFGHNMRPWAAFTVKPFMPTVLGEGHVAQFSTFSYPDYGFALSLASAACLVLALLLRRKAMNQPVETG